jgi:hypothetical protein
MATMMADANNAGATGTDLLTLWKVGRVELPRITRVYQDALAGLDGAKKADVAGPGEAFALWLKVRGELRRVLILSVRRTEAASDAVGRALAEYTGADADGRNSSAVASQELWRKINDPWEVDPGGSGTEPAARTATRNRSGRSLCTEFRRRGCRTRCDAGLPGRVDHEGRRGQASGDCEEEGRPESVRRLDRSTSPQHCSTTLKRW